MNIEFTSTVRTGNKNGQGLLNVPRVVFEQLERHKKYKFTVEEVE